MKPNELQLNRIAQGFVTVEAGLSWFEGLSVSEQAVVWKDLAFISGQAHPNADELPLAIAQSGLKPTYTPCVVLNTTAATTNAAISKIASLPAAEHVKSFRLLLALFSVADARRRASQCKGGCTHEWHNLAVL